MNLKQLRYVQVLAEQGSFSRAADELGISQPSLSQYIRKIEAETGVELFDRTGNNVRLTDAGRAYTDAGRRILDIERELKGKFTDIQEEKTGLIQIGISPYRSICLMPRVLAEFHRFYPGIQIDIDECVSHDLLERAERGDYDLCITTAPVDERKFSYRSMFEEECVLIVPKGSEADKRFSGKAREVKGCIFPAVDIKEADGENFAVVRDTQLMTQLLNNICLDYGLKLNYTVVSRSLSSVVSMVREGVGMALVPSSLVRFGSDRISCYSVIQDIPKKQVVVMYRREQVLTGAQKCLIDILTGL